MVLLREQLSNFPKPLKRALAALERGGLSGSGTVPARSRRGQPGTAADGNVRIRLDRPNHKLQAGEIQTVLEGYRRGTTLTELSRRFRVHEQTVRAHLARAGVEIRPQRVLSETQVAEIVALYRSGMALRPLARQYGVAYASIRNYLLRAGVELRPARRLPGQAASN